MTPTTSIAPINTVRPVAPVTVNPALAYERNLRAAIKAMDLAVTHNPGLLPVQVELFRALNAHLKLTGSLSRTAQVNAMAKVVS